MAPNLVDGVRRQPRLPRPAAGDLEPIRVSEFLAGIDQGEGNPPPTYGAVGPCVQLVQDSARPLVRRLRSAEDDC